MINIKNSDSDLEHKLFKCCQIQLNDEDTLSQKSCSDCIERLENCFFFIINVENTQEYLKNTQDQLFIVEFSDTTVEIKVLEQIINSDEAAPQNTEMKRELRDRKSIKKPNEVESLSMSKTEQKVTKPKRGRKKGSKRFEKLRYTMEDIFESELKSLKFKPTTTLAVPDNEKNRDGTLNEEGKNRFSTSNWSAMIWKCVDCKNEKFNNINELQNHFITAHKKKESYLCPFCPKTVSKFASCFNHVTDYHKNFLTYCCQVCDEYRWNFMDLYKHHRKAHPDNKIFLCIYCGKNFHCGSILRDHKISCHGNESGDMKQTPTGYKCNQCEKSFTLKRNLHNHMQTHLEKQHVCDKCGKTFMQKGNLLNHQITHSDLRPFTCLVCDTSFKTMKRLRFHNLTHTKVKSHVCDVCNRSFALRTTLKVHYRIHTQVIKLSLYWTKFINYSISRSLPMNALLVERNSGSIIA